MKKWEYRTVYFQVEHADKIEKLLNSYGENGWELVSTSSIESKSIGFFDSGSETSNIIGIFKREIL